MINLLEASLSGFCIRIGSTAHSQSPGHAVNIMEHAPLTPYESQQVARIAAWKADRPGLLRRGVEMLKWPVTRLFERLVPADRARAMFERLHRAADWEEGRDRIQRALGIDHVKELCDGPLEKCDELIPKLARISREIITSESLLASAGGEVTELLELPAEIMLALRTVHRVAACYGYVLEHPADESLVIAIIGLSLMDEPEDRLRYRRLIRHLEEGTLTSEEEQQLTSSAPNPARGRGGKRPCRTDWIDPHGSESRRGDSLPGRGPGRGPRQCVYYGHRENRPVRLSRAGGCASMARSMRLRRRSHRHETRTLSARA